MNHLSRKLVQNISKLVLRRRFAISAVDERNGPVWLRFHRQSTSERATVAFREWCFSYPRPRMSLGCLSCLFLCWISIQGQLKTRTREKLIDSSYWAWFVVATRLPNYNYVGNRSVLVCTSVGPNCTKANSGGEARTSAVAVAGSTYPVVTRGEEHSAIFWWSPRLRLTAVDVWLFPKPLNGSMGNPWVSERVWISNPMLVCCELLSRRFVGDRVLNESFGEMQS